MFSILVGAKSLFSLGPNIRRVTHLTPQLPRRQFTANVNRVSTQRHDNLTSTVKDEINRDHVARQTSSPNT